MNDPTSNGHTHMTKTASQYAEILVATLQSWTDGNKGTEKADAWMEVIALLREDVPALKAAEEKTRLEQIVADDKDRQERIARLATFLETAKGFHVLAVQVGHPFPGRLYAFHDDNAFFLDEVVDAVMGTSEGRDTSVEDGRLRANPKPVDASPSVTAATCGRCGRNPADKPAEVHGHSYCNNEAQTPTCFSLQLQGFEEYKKEQGWK